MKTLFIFLFLGVSNLVFGNNAIVKSDFLESKIIELKISTKKKTTMEKEKTTLAFEFNCSLDWLYKETPFWYKLKSYA